jgi:hypothetical protein
VIGVTRVGFYGAAAMAFSICKNREFYFAISGEPSLQFPVKLVYNKQTLGRLLSTLTLTNKLLSWTTITCCTLWFPGLTISIYIPYIIAERSVL